MRKKIVAALATGLTFGALFAAPVTVAAAETASGSALNQTAVSANVEQADRLFNEGKFAEAAELYEKAAEATGNNDTLWFKSGDAYYCAGIYDKSVSSCKQAIKLNPNNGLAYNICGIAYYGQLTKPHSLSSRTILERAEKYEERAVELLPNSANIRQAAGTIQASLATFVGSTREKHLRKAYQHYCRAVDLAPNDSEKAKLLSNFVQKWSRYGFQPYNPAPQPAPETAGQSAGKTDVTGAANVPSGGTPNVSGDLHSLIYTPLQSENTVLAFCPLDGNGDISEIYLNPYKTGREYIVISTFPYEGGRGYYQVFGTFAYTPDDPDDPSAGGEFLFTGESRSYYYMRARVIGETTLKIEWVTGDTQSGPQTRQPDAIRPYSEDIYELQPITEEQLGYMNHVLRVPYRFVSKHGHIPKFCEADFSAMFAFIDFLNEGNSLDMIAEPPQGMALPGEAGDFKQPGKYRKTGTGVAAAR